jgi:predicted small secreted protein
MKKTLLIVVAVVLAAAVIMGCNSPTQVEGSVGIDASRAAAPSEVKAVATTPAGSVIVTWKAAQNVTGYSVYYRINDSKTITTASVTANSGIGYDAAGNSTTANKDYDSYWAAASISSANTGDVFTFGVASSGVVNGGLASTGSDIVWAADKITK